MLEHIRHVIARVMEKIEMAEDKKEQQGIAGQGRWVADAKANDYADLQEIVVEMGRICSEHHPGWHSSNPTIYQLADAIRMLAKIELRHVAQPLTEKE
jgi:hypothetical protein